MVVALRFRSANPTASQAGKACLINPSGQLMQNASCLSTSFFARQALHGLQSANGANSRRQNPCSCLSAVQTAGMGFKFPLPGVETPDYCRSSLRDMLNMNSDKAKQKGLTVFARCIADFMHTPSVDNIGLSACTGKPGEAITIQASDEVEVAGVAVRILDTTGAVLERGRPRPTAATGPVRPPQHCRWTSPSQMR